MFELKTYKKTEPKIGTIDLGHNENWLVFLGGVYLLKAMFYGTRHDTPSRNKQMHFEACAAHNVWWKIRNFQVCLDKLLAPAENVKRRDHR